MVPGPMGRPAPRCYLWIEANDGGIRRLRTDKDGRFEAPGLRPVDYTLSAGGMGAGYARSQAVTLLPDEGQVELHLGASGAIRGRVLGGSRMGTLEPVLVSARHPGNRGDDRTRIVAIFDGYFFIDGLAPGTYDVFVRDEDGRCGLAAIHQVEEGPAVDELQIELGEGGRLTPRLVAGVRWASYELFLDGAFLDQGSCVGEQSETHLLPEGTLEVRFEGGEGRAGVVFTEVRAGVTLEVELGFR